MEVISTIVCGRACDDDWPFQFQLSAEAAKKKKERKTDMLICFKCDTNTTIRQGTDCFVPWEQTVLSLVLVRAVCLRLCFSQQWKSGFSNHFLSYHHKKHLKLTRTENKGN